MGTNVWREEEDWPMARAHRTPFYLASGGRANTLVGMDLWVALFLRVNRQNTILTILQTRCHLEARAMPGTNARLRRATMC
jgi:predicted acyl esterase